MKQKILVLYLSLTHARIDREFGSISTTEQWEEYRQSHGVHRKPSNNPRELIPESTTEAAWPKQSTGESTTISSFSMHDKGRLEFFRNLTSFYEFSGLDPDRDVLPQENLKKAANPTFENEAKSQMVSSWEDFGTSSEKPDYESGRDEKFRIDRPRIKINIQNQYYVALCPATL